MPGGCQHPWDMVTRIQGSCWGWTHWGGPGQGEAALDNWRITAPGLTACAAGRLRALLMQQQRESASSARAERGPSTSGSILRQRHAGLRHSPGSSHETPQGWAARTAHPLLFTSPSSPPAGLQGDLRPQGLTPRPLAAPSPVPWPNAAQHPRSSPFTADLPARKAALLGGVPLLSPPALGV